MASSGESDAETRDGYGGSWVLEGSIEVSGLGGLPGPVKGEDGALEDGPGVVGSTAGDVSNSTGAGVKVAALRLAACWRRANMESLAALVLPIPVDVPADVLTALVSVSVS